LNPNGFKPQFLEKEFDLGNWESNPTQRQLSSGINSDGTR
jgi:hypothetical protein